MSGIPGEEEIAVATILAEHDFDVLPRHLFADFPNNVSGGKGWRCARLQLSVKDVADEERKTLDIWRLKVREDFTASETLLRKVCHILIYAQPPSNYIHVIPALIRTPLLGVLYKWELKKKPSNNQKRFTGTCDEEGFYLACVPIELRGVEVLQPMHASMGEMWGGGGAQCRCLSHGTYPSHTRDGAHGDEPAVERQGVQAGRGLSSHETLVFRAGFGEEVEI
ncbi:hypothetical protein BKA83DRAFT_4130290 [Pisolithus microcarpus]|nr:hypothetical protein BKA83DRAFT_4130290 [Pisolithus microcarpus]